MDAPLPGTAGSLSEPRTSTEAQALALITNGSARSRRELKERMNLSASTISTVVRRLIERGAIEEFGSENSTGGRRPMRLRATRGDTGWLVAELGSGHLRLGLSRADEDVPATQELELDIASGPDAATGAILDGWQTLLDNSPSTQITSAAVAFPGPISATTGELVTPSRMPGWHGSHITTDLSSAIGVPVLAENDARAAALGESTVRGDSFESFIYVKAGSGIGGAFFRHGELLYGGTGLAGDITHVPVPGAGDHPCSCGRQGCLETVASGAAIRRELESKGMQAGSVADVLELALTFEPAATSAVRQSGKHLGNALSPLVNFLNPSAVLIGGSLSSIDAFVAAVRSAVYDSGLAMNTQALTIEHSAAGRDAALIGLTRLARHTTPAL